MSKKSKTTHFNDGGVRFTTVEFNKQGVHPTCAIEGSCQYSDSASNNKLMMEGYKAQCNALMTAIVLARAELLQANATDITTAQRRKHIRAANKALMMPRRDDVKP